MVAINSQSLNRTGLEHLSQITVDEFAGLDFKPKYLEAKSDRFSPHLVLNADHQAKKRILLVSHLDTVYTTEEEQHNNFSWKEVEDKVYGPGVIDIKGGTVMIALVLKALKEFYPDLYQSVNWAVLLNSSEEMGIGDFSSLYREMFDFKHVLAALVFEAGRFEKNSFKIVVSRKGIVHCYIRVYGRGGHAGNAHHLGASAINQLSLLITKFEKLTDYETGITVNTGIVTGGKQRNRIPEFAEAVMEIRAFDAGLLKLAIEEINSYAGDGTVKSHSEGKACDIEIEFSKSSDPWSENRDTNGLFAIWKQAGSDLGYTVVKQKRSGGSDACGLWDLCPTIDGLGPSGDNAHCSESIPERGIEPEYLQISSIVPKALLNVTALVRLLKTSS